MRPVAGVLAGAVTQFNLTILDNDPLVTVTRSAPSILESQAATFMATLSAPTNVPVTVSFRVSGDAVKGSDYSLSANAFVIPASELTGSIQVNALIDGRFEPAEFVILSLAPSTGVLLGQGTSTSIPIVNIDLPPAGPIVPTALFTTNNFTLTERADGRSISVAVSPAPTQDVYVTFAFAGTAILNSDYAVAGLEGNRLRIPANVSSASFTLTALADAREGAVETIQVTMSSVSGASLPPAGANRENLLRTIAIHENDKVSEPKTAPKVVVTAPPAPPKPAGAGVHVAAAPKSGKPGSEGAKSPNAPPPGTKPVPNAPMKSKGTQGALFGSTAFFDANFNGVSDFLDLNADGIQDLGEPSEPTATTDLDGSFVISIPGEFDLNMDGELTPDEGRWALAGGTDAATGLPWTTRLYAPLGHFAITPLTTLVENLVRTHGYSLPDAEQRVLAAFGLENIELATLSPLEGIEAGDRNAALAFAAHVKVYNTVIGAAELMAGAAEFEFGVEGILPLDALADLVYATLAANITQPGASLELSDASIVESILHGLEFATGVTLPAADATGASVVIAANNEQIDAVPLTVDLPYATAIVKAKKVAQKKVARELGEVGKKTKDIADVENAFTGEALAAEVAAAIAEIVIPPTISVSPTFVREGAAGTRTLEFRVALQGDHGAAVSVNYFTLDETATTDGGDYLAASGVLNWAAGDNTSRTVQITVNGDGDFEQDESFSFVLSDSMNAVLLTESTIGYILNDDVLAYTVDSVPAGQTNEILAELDETGGYFASGDVPLREGFFTDPLVLTLHGLDDQNDLLTLDFSANSFRSDVIRYHGGGGTGVDSARIRGGRFTAITMRLTNATDGQTILDPEESTELVTFDWFDLEPFSIQVDSLTDAIFELPAGATDAILEDADPTDADETLAGKLRLRSPSGHFETIVFTSPTGSIVLRGGNGADTITIGTLDPAFTGTVIVKRMDDPSPNTDSIHVVAIGGANVELLAGVTLAPGGATGIGQANVSSLTLSGAQFQVNLNGAGAGTGHDQSVASSVALTSAALELTLGGSLRRASATSSSFSSMSATIRSMASSPARPTIRSSS